MKLLRLVPAETKLSFIKWHKLAMAASAALFVVSLIVAFYPGLNFGIDFRGGILMEVGTSKPVDLGLVRTELNKLNLGEVAVQEFGDERTVLIRIERQSGGEGAQDQAENTVKATLDSMFTDVDYRRTELVGPKVSSELIEKGIIAVTLAVLLMLIYIWFRFEWHFGVGAVIALLHDVGLSIGMFALTQLEFNLSTIAALLTIVGYSINDTVVVYDRVRENLRKYKAMALGDVLNLSINDTLSRTTMTSVTTLLALIALFIFGGEVIKGFVFAMIWGIFVGTYSSIFVAAPLLMILGLDQKRLTEDAEGAAAEAGD